MPVLVGESDRRSELTALAPLGTGVDVAGTGRLASRYAVDGVVCSEGLDLRNQRAGCQDSASSVAVGSWLAVVVERDLRGPYV